ncbi:hypothetical protein MY10362_005411 [Beauveria mimosiformis]
MNEKTALLLIGPLNEFLHPDGQIYPLLRESLEATSSVKNIRRLVAEARRLRVPVYYCQHQLTAEGHFASWNHKSKSQKGIEKTGSFRLGSFGGQIYKGLEPDPRNGDVEVSRHWNSRSDATAGFSIQLKDVAEKIVWPTIVDAVSTVDEWSQNIKVKREDGKAQL